MANIVLCDAGWIQDGSGVISCPVPITFTTEVSDSAFFQEALYNIDLETVDAIFNAGLLLFVVGMGAGWAVHVLRMAR